MVPLQTLEVFMGVLAAWFYFFAVLTIGVVSLAALIGRNRTSAVRAHIGLFGLLWLAFIMGQGMLGLVWLVLSLAGVFHSWLIWIVCALGWFLGGAILLAFRRQAAQSLRQFWTGLLSFLGMRSWYFCIALGVIIIALLQGLIALLPTENDDALSAYLPVAKAIAFSHTLDFQPFVYINNGLYPLQIELHWAALFAISNETAVSVWDYLCALSSLTGVALLAWSVTSSRRVAVLAALMLLSTPGFYIMMGSGRPDNAATQYGIAAFLWLVLFPALRHPSILLAGLCAGWAMGSRYQNFILAPALIAFAVMVTYHPWRLFPLHLETRLSKRFWVTNILVGGIGAAVAGMPMLIKNWLLVGCPLAPVFGCQQAFWAAPSRTGLADFNLSVIDLFFYPFVWTFAYRDDMLGNISPLFTGFLPFLLVSYRSSVVRPALMAGCAGVISLSTWLFVKPLILCTPYLIPALGLLALPLSASVVAAEQHLLHNVRTRWAVRGAILLVLFFLLFQSRGVVYAVRYIASIDSRAVRYESMPDTSYDVATWLNAHVQSGLRVSLANFSIYKYFLDSNVLMNSESAKERQWLWENRDRLSPSDFWHFYAQHGFTYVVVPKNRLNDANSVNMGLQVAFVGRAHAVLKIEKL